MNHLSVFGLILIIKFAQSQVTDILLSAPRQRHGYSLGERVTLTCVVKGRDMLSLLIQHNGVYKSENGLCHFDEYKCDVQNVGDRRHFILTINKLSWDDRGEWSCMQRKGNMKKIIDIKVPGKVQPLAARLKYDEDKNEKGYVQRMLYGKGLRTNPYDLIQGASLVIHCSTGCSSPASKHDWRLFNQSISSRKITVANTLNFTCKFDFGGEGTRLETSVIIHCASLSMVGSNEVTCSRRDSTDSQSVFVLCPGGHRPLILTNGEIIGISIAVGIAALMVITFFMSAKRVVNNYRYGAVGQGIRV